MLLYKIISDKIKNNVAVALQNHILDVALQNRIVKNIVVVALQNHIVKNIVGVALQNHFVKNIVGVA